MLDDIRVYIELCLCQMTLEYTLSYVYVIWLDIRVYIEL